jgi:hypothetical protein
MTFTGGIPQPGQSLGQTQAAVNNNFTNYFNAFSVNHVQPNGNMTYPQGKHTFCEFVSQAESPATSTAEVSVYCRTISSVPQLCLQKANQLANAADIQMSRVDTGVGINGQNGWTFLPGGIIFQWGIGTFAALSNVNITFATLNINFTNACFNVSLTPIAFNNFLDVTNVTTTGFTCSRNPNTQNGQQFFWTAIGN